MKRTLSGMFLLLLACGLADAAPINMPDSSVLWLEMDSNACDPDGDSDCIGSNQFGANPAAGIPPTTFIDGTTSVTGSAEAYPDLMRSYLSANTGAFMYMSMLDTYTVHGTASGTFSITAHFGASGTATSLNGMLIGANARVEIGTFNTTSGVLSEQFRVQPFSAATTALQSIPSQVATVTVPINVATSHSSTVGVGDVFSLAFGLTTSVGSGNMDLLNTAHVTFDLPEGVYLTSANGGIFGTVPAAADDGPIAAPEGVAKVIPVGANDTGFTDPVTVTITTPPAKGTITAISPSGPAAGMTISYTASIGSSGFDSFVYQMTDGTPASDLASVTLNIGPDADTDNVLDTDDNCTLLANPTQCDSDGDGYGNRCDADMNNNGSTNAQDTTLYRQQLGQPSVGPTFNEADLNCNGAVNAQDTTLFRQQLGLPPGPSGLVP